MYPGIKHVASMVEDLKAELERMASRRWHFCDRTLAVCVGIPGSRSSRDTTPRQKSQRVRMLDARAARVRGVCVFGKRQAVKRI